MTPQKLYLLAAIPLQLLYLWVLPPLQYKHAVERTLHVVEYVMAFSGHAGQVPLSFLEMTHALLPDDLEKIYPDQAPQWDRLTNKQNYFSNNAEEVTHHENVRVALAIPLNIDKSVPLITTATAANRPILAYLPQLIGAAIGLGLQLPPLVIFYLMTIVNTALTLYLGYYVLKLMPILKRALLVILMLPSVFVMRSFMMPDMLVIELCFLLIALALSWRLQNKLLSRHQWAIILGLSLLVGFIKIAYFLVPLAWLFLPRQCFTSDSRRFLCIGGAIALSFAAGLSWDLYAVDHVYHAGVLNSEVDTTSSSMLHHQLSAIWSNPLGFAFDVASSPFHVKTLFEWQYNIFFWRSNLHGIAVPMQQIFILFSLMLLPVLAIMPGKEDANWLPTRTIRWLALAVFLINFVLILTIDYIGNPLTYGRFLAFTPENYFPYVQGRFFIPILPLLFVVMYRAFMLPEVHKATASRTLAAVSVVTLITAHVMMLMQY